MTLTPHSHGRIAALAVIGAALFLVAAPAHAGIGADDGNAPAVTADSGCAGTDAIFAALPADEPSADDALAAQQAARSTPAQGTEVTSDDRGSHKVG